LQNAVVQVTSEPNPFSGGRSLFGLALQNLPVELHSDPRRDKLTALTIVHRDQLDPGISDVFDTDWKAPDASMGTSDPISE